MVSAIPNQFSAEIYKLAQRVMVIDSEPFLAEMIKAEVSSIGHIYAGRAFDFKSMENLLSTEPIDLVIIHLEMKGELSSIQIAKLLKIEHDIPFYFACTKHCEELKIWASEINPDGYISITSSRIKLKSDLARLLD